jgi:hypothetical protein
MPLPEKTTDKKQVFDRDSNKLLVHGPDLSDSEDKRARRKLVSVTIAFTREEKEYLDKIVVETGTNRHKVLATLLNLHGARAVSFLNTQSERNDLLLKVKMLENSNRSLTTKIAHLEKNKKGEVSLGDTGNIDKAGVKKKKLWR